jgi:hypothetical protein
MKKIAFLLIFYCVSAFSSPQPLGRFQGWTVFKAVQNKKAFYYAVTRPQKTLRKSKNVSKTPAKKPYLMVSILNNKPLITIYTGVILKDFSELKLSLGKQCSVLYTKKNAGFVPDQTTEKKIIENMKTQSFLEVRLPNNTGQDQYGLKGFSKAYETLLRAATEKDQRFSSRPA